MRKVYILDTSVLVYDPLSLKSFPDSDIILPVAVLEELDKLKKQFNDIGAGRNARVVIRALDDISNKGDISVGVMTDNNAVVKIDIGSYPNEFGDTLYGDTRILSCAYHTNKNSMKEFGEGIIFVSKDINLRVRARASGIETEDYEKGEITFSDLYEGSQTIEHVEAGMDLKSQGYIDPRCFQFKLNINEYVCFTDELGNEIAKGKKIAEDKIKLVKRSFPWGLSPKNKEQEFAIDLILDAKIPLVTLIGKAGTGKSLIALASALELVLEKKMYDKFIIYRPIESVGSDIGFLPGTIEEKLAPWFQAVMDNFELLFTSSHNDKWRQNLDLYTRKEKIQMEAITYIRGRSIPNAIILIDECQNLTKEEVKTILTRVGENTKIILTGDVEQIDKVSLNSTNNGLTYVIEKFKHSELSGHITFTKGERSALATEASKIL